MRLVPLLFLLSVVGCGESPKSPHSSEREDRDGRLPANLKRVIHGAAGQAEKKEDQPAKDEVQRKLIYNGRMRLVTTDYDKSKAMLADLIKDFKGYTLNSDEQSTPGVPRRLTLTARIPAARSEEFRKDVGRAGEVVSSSLEAEDVTDRYYDTKAELVNREARETALRELYKSKQAGSKLSELLEIDREIEKVRSDINVRMGQIKRWDKLTEYATFAVTLEERTGYSPQESPYFGTRIARTFNDSLHVMYLCAQGLTLFLVGAAPWLVLLVAVLGPIYILTRRKPPPAPPPPAPTPTPRPTTTESDSPETLMPE